MLAAGLWGGFGALSLLLGAGLGLAFTIPRRAIGLVMGFGAGVLISALAFELTAEAFAAGGADAVAAGLAAGALAFFLGDWAIDRFGGDHRKSCTGKQANGSPSGLLLGAILDGIPESTVIGTTLLMGEGISLPVVAAVFLSNLPESLSSATGMRHAGHSPAWVLGVWSAVVAVCALSAALGFALLADASGNWVGFIQAFAAGAVLTMLADTMMPEAFEHGGKAVGLATAFGFAAAFLLSMIA
ncbi:MAG: ZIP family zinc transporter [Gemmatimonadota bacterium]|nr:ZIP family zinc transporter [Gemmatimonadota bacterium]